MNKRNGNILFLVDEFLEETGMGPAYFGKKSVGNSELVKRLRNGKDIFSSTERRVRDFIREYRKAKRHHKK
ncbi:MAG: hypothetical protein [Caudoviricetes sp.]|nr:MAG: hypothetical protein [Caudoviricetes sp.]